MRLRPRRRSLLRSSLPGDSASRYETPGFTRLARARKIRRSLRTGALLTAIGLLRLTRGVRSRWRPLSAGAVLTVIGFMLRNSAWDLIFATGPLLFVYPLLTPVRSDAERKRRYDIERELPVYSIPVESHQIVWPP